MDTKAMTLAALVSSVLLANVQGAAAQTNPPPSATATRPATNIAGANFRAKRQPAGHNNSDNR